MRNPDRRTSILPLLLASLLLLGLAACGESTQEISEVRQGREAPPAQPQAAAPPKWDFATPEGWQPLPPKPMRDAGWTVPGEALCTFTVLPGAAGGLLGNVNRWRAQMGLDPVAEAALADLPKAQLIDRPAPLVELEGEYGGMGGQPKIEGAKMIALVIALPNATVFLKMTGQAKAVDAEREHFLALAKSLRPRRAPPRQMPPGHGMGGMGATPPPRKARLAWTAPAGWKAQGARPFREATWKPNDHTNTEAWVSVLVGDGGGLVENVNRWQAQMGQPALSKEAVEALPKLEAMGKEGVLVEIGGAYSAGNTGMGGKSEASNASSMLAFALLRGEDSIFVKMVGPANEVKAEEENFKAFCRSLRNP